MADCKVAHKCWIVDVVLMFFFPPKMHLGVGEKPSVNKLFTYLFTACVSRSKCGSTRLRIVMEIVIPTC